MLRSALPQIRLRPPADLTISHREGLSFAAIIIASNELA